LEIRGGVVYFIQAFFNPVMQVIVQALHHVYLQDAAPACYRGVRTIPRTGL
jgi:hypothetical protein